MGFGFSELYGYQCFGLFKSLLLSLPMATASSDVWFLCLDIAGFLAVG